LVEIHGLFAGARGLFTPEELLQLLEPPRDFHTMLACCTKISYPEVTLVRI
jgi:hypothetical protein